MPVVIFGGGGGGEAAEIQHIELDLKLSGSVLRFKEFSYTGGDLTQQDVYTDATKTTKIYTLVYSYSSGSLSTLTVTRESDSYGYVKTFAYNPDGTLLSINITPVA